MTTPQTAVPPAPVLGPEGEACLDCGAALAADQRYCLNCGRRRGPARVDHHALLIASPAAGPSPAEAVPAAAPPPGRALSPLGAAAATGLLLLAVLVGAVLGSAGDEDPQPVASGAAPLAAQAAAPAAFKADWTGGGGWTIRLQAFDKATTQPGQVEQAEQAASAKGVPDVGSLDSDPYPTLGAGQYVVYSGRFTSEKQARGALRDVRAAFPDAAVVQVSAKEPPSDAGEGGDSGGDGAASGADPAAQKKLEELESSSPEEYQKKSRKLPDEVSTGGKQEPKDDKAPSGGDQGGTTIG